MSGGVSSRRQVQGDKFVKRLLTALALVGLLCTSSAVSADDKVDLKLTKYDELTKFIASQKGKIVVVDFWADT
jgi:hypothetical protein